MTDTPAAPAPQEAPKDENAKLCKMLYGIFAFSMVLQFIDVLTIILGTAAITAGIILAYMERKKATGTLYENHLHWLIRTFWIGGAVYMPITTVLGSTALIFLLDRSPIQEAMSTGDTDLQTAIHAMLLKNHDLMYHTMLAFTLPFAVWWMWRCWYGYKRFKAGKTVPNVMSWF